MAPFESRPVDSRSGRPLVGKPPLTIRREDFAPCYSTTHREGRLGSLIEQARGLLAPCRVCARQCGADRAHDLTGICRTGHCAEVSCAFPHHGEEDVLRGTRGSGTIFFGHCNLGCVFCQNYETSHGDDGRAVTAEELAGLMLRLQAAGCHNINFVTPSHVVPQILEALPLAIEHGLRIPLVYNSGGYDSVETLHCLDGVIDIYMPDFKLWNPLESERWLRAPDYPEVARAVVREMHRQVGDLVVDESGIACRGLLIRHLVMPGQLEQTREILRFIARDLSCDTYINVMAQYHPAGEVPGNPALGPINRRLNAVEYRAALDLARDAGLWRLE